MAAYGALVSLSHILRQILYPPPLNKIVIDIPQIELLYDKVYSLIDFLETYSGGHSEEIEDLERRITDAAYEGEDVIESNVLNQIHSAGEELCKLLCEGVQRVLEKFLSIEEELPTTRVVQGISCLQLRSSATANSSRSVPDGKISTVGFDDHLIWIMSALASDEPGRLIIPIVGMGGIGKTTLARIVYKNPFVVEYFHLRAWVTVSQEYTVRELLLSLLCEKKAGLDEQESRSNDELGLQLHKKLFGRRYLIVLDDMWNIQAWDELKMFLPHNENGSRVLVTSRISNLADDFGSCAPYNMHFLDEGHSWDLFRKTIFAEEDCPIELEEIGKDIAKGCGGLPLALVVIGGLLAVSERTREHWEFLARDMTSGLNFGNDEQVMKILSLSYTHMPVYLKPCFLYLAMFPEDSTISVSQLVKLWVAEGLIKPIQDKCLEEVAHEILEDLISRNVILVDEWGSRGKVKSCKLHDCVRDLCIAQAEREKFVYILQLDNPNISPNIETQRRLRVSTTSKPLEVAIKALRSATLNRSWLSPTELFGFVGYKMKGWEYSTYEIEPSIYEIEPSTSEKVATIASSGSMDPLEEMKNQLTQMINDFRLLKIVQVRDVEFCIDMSNLSNIRYVVAHSLRSYYLSDVTLYWNLQTLILFSSGIDLPPEIWQMPQLRHLKVDLLYLADPPDDDQNATVLENLQTLRTVVAFKGTDQVVKRIPNLKKLRTSYETSDAYEGENFCLHNLARFEKLESLRVDHARKIWWTLAFPISLQKLTLLNCGIPWEDFSVVVGSLPNLEVVNLYLHATEGEEWNPIEGTFCRLKFLRIEQCELKMWGAENYNFPCLERLILAYVPLEEIPRSFSEILTLQTIVLSGVHDSTWKSAREISEERELLGYDPLLRT